MPPPWLETNTPKAIGGNLLCKEVPTADESSGLYLLTGASSACGTSVGEHIKIPRLSNLFALIGANLVRSNLTTDFIDDVCATIQTVDDFSCKDEYILPSLGFLLNDSMVDPSLLTNLRSMAEVAQNDMHALVVEINQYGRTVNGTAVVMRHEIFNPTYPSFHYIAWVLAMEWATNNREVISFQGNIGSANVLTARSFDVASLINPLEIPVNVAYYIRYVYYIDPASAAINGILSIQVGSTFCLFDLKTWRLFAINVSKENRERIKQEGKLHLLSSIPLPS
ncbi:unnamed protein product [Aphanomyces euteiches]